MCEGVYVYTGVHRCMKMCAGIDVQVCPAVGLGVYVCVQVCLGVGIGMQVCV